MSARDDAIKAGERALDLSNEAWDIYSAVAARVVVDAVESIIRADEREKVLKGVIGIADHLERRATTVPVTAGALLLHQADGVELVISYLRGEQP